MNITVEIDPDSGFCGGVIRAVDRAEEYLSGAEHSRLYSLGSIVHNEAELSRLRAAGLVTIGLSDLPSLHKGDSLLIRAHGEPPSTYVQAQELGLEVIDCTCPVVLNLQKSIREAYARVNAAGGQIVIFGKVGHAEVLGLLGQVGGDAVVIENMDMFMEALSSGKIRLEGPVEIFSQTTKSPAEYSAICCALREAMAKEHELSEERFRGTGLLAVHDTICRQVARRHERLSDFALHHDIIIFVSGSESSNGKVLCNLCRSLNIRTYHVSNEDGIRPEWFRHDDRVGVCGATSTPKWLLESVASRILAMNG